MEEEQVIAGYRVVRRLGAAGQWRNRTPLWLRAYGLRLEPELHGLVLRWARLSSGDWLAEVQVAVPTGHCVVPLTTWVSQTAVRACDWFGRTLPHAVGDRIPRTMCTPVELR